MTLHDEQVFARKIMNTVTEVFQTHDCFTKWLAHLGPSEQIRISTTMLSLLRRDIREIESAILGKEFKKDVGKNREDVSPDE